jgi:hypothetical protein
MIMKSIMIGTTVQRLCTPAAARPEPRSEFVVGDECLAQTPRTGQHPTSRHVSFLQYVKSRNNNRASDRCRRSPDSFAWLPTFLVRVFQAGRWLHRPHFDVVLRKLISQ